MPEFIVGYNSDRGVTHQINQDSLCLKVLSHEGKKMVVAGLFDGMGGLSEGERVSGAAAKTVSAWTEKNAALLFSENPETICERLSLMLDELNAKIRGYSQRTGVETGTTAVILIIGQGTYISCNVGDSRAYLIRENETEQITEDHSLAASLVKAGLLTKDEAKTYAQKNVLLQALGTLEKITPAFKTGLFQANDAFLLCCDGFYHELSDAEIQNLYSAGNSRETLTNTLTTATSTVISRGETDNITSILIKTMK